MAETNVLNFFEVIPKTTITTIKDYFDVASNGNKPFIGICLLPNADVATGNTTSFNIEVVSYDAGNDKVLLYNAGGINTLSINNGKGPVVTNPNIFRINLTSPTILNFFDRTFYNGTSEFEYAFLDYEIIKYYMSSDVFYLKTPGGTTILDRDNIPVTEDRRGFRIERALVQYNRPFLSLLTGNNDQNIHTYRTLKVQPYPDPVLLQNQTKLSAIAYYVVPTCPPLWRIQNTTLNPGGSSKVSGALASTSPNAENEETSSSKKQVVNPGENQELIPYVYRINQEDIRTALIESGAIPAERPVYKMKIWPLILGAILTIIGLIAAGIVISRTGLFDFGFNKGEKR